MRSAALQAMIFLAVARESDPIASAVVLVNKGLEVDPKELAVKLEADGYNIRATKLNHVVRAELFKDGALLASGTSSDTGDALLQGVYGYLKDLR